MINQVKELCRKLRPVIGRKIDRIWAAYLAESEASGKADIEQVLELLAAKHLGQNYEPDRSPFPPPAEGLAGSGDVPLGTITYGNRVLYPFLLKGDRLKEHILIAGRSGSGKTNLTFVLMQGIMARGIKVLALDWKRGYRDLLTHQKDLRIYTIGRDISPFRFNPLIPPPGCEPGVWIKLIVDVIAGAYLGGEGVISLLVAGLDKLFRDAGVFDKLNTTWPTIQDLLTWLKTVKLKGRAAMWQASAERILLAMSYGEFASVVNTQDNSHIRNLLDHNVVLEMDGLSSSSDRTMFSEALTLYLYRYRLAQGPQPKLTNLIVLEEAHNLLLRKSAESKESILETSIRMIRQYGMGYVFVDQSASMISKVAFANSYATIALSQKLRDDIQAITSAMNLTDEQKQALNTLPVGTAIIRLADEYPEPFLVKVPRFPVQEGSVSDEIVRNHMAGNYTDSGSNEPLLNTAKAFSPIPIRDKKEKTSDEITVIQEYSHPMSVEKSETSIIETENSIADSSTNPPFKVDQQTPRMTREEIRFLTDIAARPLSTTVSRYQRLNLSRRRGNAIRQHLDKAAIIEAVPIATRSGQVVLYQIADWGRSICSSIGIELDLKLRESLEHRYWVKKAAAYFNKEGFETTREHPIKGNGAIDLLAERPGLRIAVEVETGKSDIKENLAKTQKGDFSRVVLIATSPTAVTACQNAIEKTKSKIPVELMTWLDMS